MFFLIVFQFLPQVVSFGILRVSLLKTLWFFCFFWSQTLLKKVCVNLFRFDLISKPFWAGPSSVVWIRAVRLCI